MFNKTRMSVYQACLPADRSATSVLTIAAMVVYLVAPLVALVPQATYAVGSGGIIINEFSSASDPEWVELLNTTESPVSLDGWTIKDIANDPKSLSDLGTIPAHGIVVFENPSGWLNNDPDPIETITLFDDVGTPIHSVSYGDGEVDVSAPDDGESAYLLALPSTWVIAGDTPTKGWFNIAQDFNCETLTPPLPPTLISIQDCLEEDGGIISNIGELDNPSATPDEEEGEGENDDALYFSNDEGKIVFEQTLNLTDEATVDILQELGEKMDMSEGFVSFDSDTADAMAVMSAKIYMYGLDELGFTSEPNLIVKDDLGNVIGPEDENYPDIDSDYDEESGTLVFTTSHFTQFEVEMGSISGYKWNDLNVNGIRDWDDEDGNEEKDDGEEYTEPGLPGWTIILTDEGGNEVEDITDANGFYFFTDLEDAVYSVCERNKRVWTRTFPDLDDGEIEIDDDEGCHEIEIEGDSQTNVDFGNVQKGHIVVRKATYPESEQEFDFYFDNSEGEIGEEFSLSGGGEQILEVVPGTYTISETVPPDWRLDNIVCEYDGESVGESAPPSGETVTLDAGDTVTCTFTNIAADQTIITGHKWEDTNGDGVKDDGEPARKGWNIALGRVMPHEDDAPTIPIEIVALSLTGADGLYYLPVNEQGEYKVFEEKRDGWSVTNPSAVDSFFDIEYRIRVDTEPQLVEDSFFDVFVDRLFGQTITNEVNDVKDRPLDFGNFELVDITGFKWNDEDGDGVWDIGERGLGDVIVGLGRVSGESRQEDGHEIVPIEIIAMDLTGTNGDFVIRDVGPGHYKLFEEKKSDWQATNPQLRADSFFDITYDFDSIGDPDFDLLRVTGDPDFDLLRSSFFDVFVELSGQDVNQSEETGDGLVTTSILLEFGNQEITAEEPPIPTPTPEPTPTPTPEPTPTPTPFVGGNGPIAGGGGFAAPSITSQGQVLGASTENLSVEERIAELKAEIARLKILLIGAITKKIAELQAELDALLQSNR